MRRILIDHARRHAYAKRGGGAQQVSLDEVANLTSARGSELLRLDEALKILAGKQANKIRQNNHRNTFTYGPFCMPKCH